MEEHEHHFLRLAGKIAGTTLLIAPAVLLPGYFLSWNQPAQYNIGQFFISD